MPHSSPPWASEACADTQARLDFDSAILLNLANVGEPVVVIRNGLSMKGIQIIDRTNLSMGNKYQRPLLAAFSAARVGFGRRTASTDESSEQAKQSEESRKCSPCISVRTPSVPRHLEERDKKLSASLSGRCPTQAFFGLNGGCFPREVLLHHDIDRVRRPRAGVLAAQRTHPR